MEKILIDTDVIIDFLRGYKKRIKTIFEKIGKKEITAYISTVSIVELYAGSDSKDFKKEEILIQLLDFLKPIPLEPIIAKVAGSLKSKYYLSLADSVIAGTSIKTGLVLLSFNIKHFRNIPDLHLYYLQSSD